MKEDSTPILETAEILPIRSAINTKKGGAISTRGNKKRLQDVETVPVLRGNLNNLTLALCTAYAELPPCPIFLLPDIHYEGEEMPLWGAHNLNQCRDCCCRDCCCRAEGLHPSCIPRLRLLDNPLKIDKETRATNRNRVVCLSAVFHSNMLKMVPQYKGESSAPPTEDWTLQTEGDIVCRNRSKEFSHNVS